MLKALAIGATAVVALTEPAASNAPGANADSQIRVVVRHAQTQAVELTDCSTRLIRKPALKIIAICHLPSAPAN